MILADSVVEPIDDIEKVLVNVKEIIIFGVVIGLIIALTAFIVVFTICKRKKKTNTDLPDHNDMKNIN